MRFSKAKFDLNLVLKTIILAALSMLQFWATSFSFANDTKVKTAQNKKTAGALTLVFDDIVQKIEDSESHLKIAFKHHSAFYKVKHSTTHKVALQRVLNESRHDQIVVTVVVNPNSLEILDAKIKTD